MPTLKVCVLSERPFAFSKLDFWFQHATPDLFSCRICVVLGPTGSGKTRFVADWLRQQSRAFSRHTYDALSARPLTVKPFTRMRMFGNATSSANDLIIIEDGDATLDGASTTFTQALERTEVPVLCLATNKYANNPLRDLCSNQNVLVLQIKQPPVNAVQRLILERAQRTKPPLPITAQMAWDAALRAQQNLSFALQLVLRDVSVDVQESPYNVARTVMEKRHSKNHIVATENACGRTNADLVYTLLQTNIPLNSTTIEDAAAALDVLSSADTRGLGNSSREMRAVDIAAASWCVAPVNGQRRVTLEPAPLGAAYALYKEGKNKVTAKGSYNASTKGFTGELAPFNLRPKKQQKRKADPVNAQQPRVKKTKSSARTDSRVQSIVSAPRNQPRSMPAPKPRRKQTSILRLFDQ